jgi:transposase
MNKESEYKDKEIRNIRKSRNSSRDTIHHLGPDYHNILHKKSILEIVINEVGYKVVFYPSFHCELNYIEYNCIELKRYTHVNCQYNFVELEKPIMEVMDHISLHNIRRIVNSSKRWLWSYIDSLNEEERKHAEKVYKSHRQAINKDVR